MEELFKLLQAANGMTPMGIIALLGAIIWMLVKGQKQVVGKMDTLSNNHLHELPELVENSRKTVDVLQRIEVSLGSNFGSIHAKLDDK